MERVIPYHSNCRLGFNVDITKLPLESKNHTTEDVKTVVSEPKLITAQFSFVESMKDACDILGIPPEYGLKVYAGLVKNDVVQECLKDVFAKNLTTVMFRVTFLQQKILPACEGGEAKKRESNTSSHDDEPKATHLVSAMEVGNEIIAILKISSPNEENFKKFTQNIKEALKSSKGMLTEEIMLRLEMFAKKTEDKLKKSHYKDTCCSICYGYFSDQQSYPSSLTGMVKTLQGFIEKAEGWKQLFNSDNTRIINTGNMILREGVVAEKKGILATISGFVSNKDSSETSLKLPVGSYHAQSSDVDEDHDSFVVLAKETDNMYYMRVTLHSLSDQSDQSEDSDSEIESFTSFSLSQYPESCGDRYEKLFIILLQVQSAEEKLQQWFTSKRFLCDDRVEEGRKLLRNIQKVHYNVIETIEKLDMVTIPTEEFLENLCSANPVQTVNDYIENVMSKLPPGCDLDLLIIGKTGHGKSSTGNAILGLEKFVASASGESVTRSSSAAWGNVDGRIIKVVDTPGVCDTSEERDSIDLAIHAISEAISHCAGGFHALLLVIRFGQRMTIEERKAIGMLKCILGDSVIKTHCICVITHGDNFETEMQGTKTFPEWCREASGYLKSIFEECQYRCVLFNNKSKDPQVLKGQLIQLISNVDNLKSSGTRYTNDLFEFAKNERQRIMSANHVPQVSEGMMRDIELVLDHLKRVATNTQQRDKYASELENLKGMVENLSNRVTEVEGDQVKLLVETVFSLAEVIHGEIDKIADQSSPNPPDDGNEANGNSSNFEEASGGHNINDTFEINADLHCQTENLQNFRDNQMTDQANKVDNIVADEVAGKIKSEQNCFPASSEIVVKGGVVKSMEDLKVGEEVQAMNAKGEMCFDTVYVFGHKDPNSVAEFNVFEVEGHHVFVSDSHLVFCVRNDSEMYLPAKKLCIGDKLIVISSSEVRECKPILKITHERRRGLYAPFTKCGTIVVNGTVMSCYVDVLPHATSHALLSPVRQLYCLSPSVLAFVNGNKKKEIPAWAKFALKWI